jgi:hypothetical protein
MAFCPIFKGDCPEDENECTFWEKERVIIWVTKYGRGREDRESESKYPAHCNLRC